MGNLINTEGDAFGFVEQYKKEGFDSDLGEMSIDRLKSGLFVTQMIYDSARELASIGEVDIPNERPAPTIDTLVNCSRIEIEEWADSRIRTMHDEFLQREED